MTVTITSWMIIFSLAGWLFPDTSSFILKVEEKGDPVMMLAEATGEEGPIMMFGNYPKGLWEPMGKMTRSEASAILQLGLQSNIIRRGIDFAAYVQGFEGLKRESFTALTLSTGAELSVKREKNTLIFKGKEGATYTLYAGDVLANEVLATTPGELTPTYSLKEGKAQGWDLFPCRIEVNTTHGVDAKGASLKDPASVVLGFFSALMAQSPDYERFLSPKMDPSIKAAIKAHMPALSKRIKRAYLHSGIETQNAKTLRARDQKLLKVLSEVFGESDAIALAEINDAANDAFILLDKHEGGFGVRAIVAELLSELVPKRFQDKMK